MQIDLRGKRVLVTSGNSGLGSASVRALGKSRARVAIKYVAAPGDAEALVAELKHAGSEAIAIDADVSAPARAMGWDAKVASYVAAMTVFVDGGMTDYPDFIHGG